MITPSKSNHTVDELNNNPRRDAQVTKAAAALSTVAAPPILAERVSDAWSRAVAADRRLPPRVRLVAMRLSLFHHDPTYEEIAAGVGCCRRTAIRAIAILLEHGWLEKAASNGRGANGYRLTRPVLVARPVPVLVAS
jgi:hypothetical protein